MFPGHEQIIGALQCGYGKEVSATDKIGSGRAGSAYLLQFTDGTQICLKIDPDPKRIAREQRISEVFYGQANSKLITPNAFTRPYFPGEPLSRINIEQLSPNIRLRIALALIADLEDIHEHGILHRDIRASNLLIEIIDDGIVRCHLIDFGRAVILSDGRQAQSLLHQRSSVHPIFNCCLFFRAVQLKFQSHTAPEYVDDPSQIGFPADIYAAGVLLRSVLPQCAACDALLHNLTSREPSMRMNSCELRQRLNVLAPDLNGMIATQSYDDRQPLICSRSGLCVFGGGHL